MPDHGVFVCNIKRWIIVTGNPTTFVFDTLTQRWIENHLGLSSCVTGQKLVKVGSQLIAVGGFDESRDDFNPVKAIPSKHLVNDCNWKIVKDFISLRKPIDQNRAILVVSTKRRKGNSDSTVDSDKFIQKLFMETPIDVFRKVLAFLI